VILAVKCYAKTLAFAEARRQDGRNMKKHLWTIALSAGIIVALFVSAPVRASSCNPMKTLALLRQGQTQSVNGNKTEAVDTQVKAANEDWVCYQDGDQSSETRGKSGKASADILNGAAQDADASGDEARAVQLAKMALARYKVLARDKSLPLDVRVYADSAVQAATSP
jgi:hypothetical protein